MNLSHTQDGRSGTARRWLGRAILATVLASACLGTGTAWAQRESGDKKGPTPPLYVMPYALVIMCVGLGTMLVCRSANRQSMTKKWKSRGWMGHAEQASGGKKKGGPAVRTKQVSKEAQTALSISIAGIIPVVGLVLGAFGAWKSVRARALIAQNKLLTGDGIALAGIIVGAVMVVIQLVVTAVVVVKMFQ